VEPTPEECEQIARSVAMSPALSPSDRERVIDLLELLAARLRDARGVTTHVNPTPANPCATVRTAGPDDTKHQVGAPEPP